MPSHTSGIVEVTPALAAQWLTSNTKSRPLNEAKVAEYAEKMRLGVWREGRGMPIIRRSDGRLINGQHRLCAIIRAGVAVTLRVDVYERARKSD